ncbi:hypothetical protein [Halobiforma nitratireducens]|uniref:Uncharacterized protein n=1 Tax=Halobiforma nitratireducens JCM 10879 TaxID=1227454 RepID=M0LSB4_9EURY|nr:hypothetical protein [Halobiforma nitratireducens]EMA35324.1 hypothetical protein C446_12709 [Halobiforma nitratireducens JCM 10879]
MAEQQIDESVLKADKWSRIVALFLAIGTFLLAEQLTGEVQFNMIVAAFAGIGVRLYIPYHASIRVTDPEDGSIQDYEGTGNYHQGAVGAAVVIASAMALAVMVSKPNSTQAYLAGGGVGLVSFVLLRYVLPS